MVKLKSEINRNALKNVKDQISKLAVKTARELRDRTYDTLYSLSSAVVPFENQYGVAVKTGALRRSITPSEVQKLSPNLYQTEVFFDMNIAPHAIFVLEGTEKMEARPIHLIALELIRMQLK